MSGKFSAPLSRSPEAPSEGRAEEIATRARTLLSRLTGRTSIDHGRDRLILQEVLALIRRLNKAAEQLPVFDLDDKLAPRPFTPSRRNVVAVEVLKNYITELQSMLEAYLGPPLPPSGEHDRPPPPAAKPIAKEFSKPERPPRAGSSDTGVRLKLTIF